MKMSLLKTLARILEGTPVGRISMYAGSAAPAGWLLCQGQAVSRTRYPKLFEVIGTTYGSGDGSTTFNLPDMRGRFPLGIGETQPNNQNYWGSDVSNLDGASTNFTAGEKGGEAKHTLNTNQMPTHWHGIRLEYGAQPSPSYPPGSEYAQVTNNTNYGYTYTNTPTSPEGNGQAHNNLPPYSVINFIIYVGGVLYSSIFKAFKTFASLRKGGGVDEDDCKGTALKSGEHYITGEYNRPKPRENSNYTHCKLQPYIERSDLLYVCAFSIYDKKHEIRRILSSHISSVERRRRDNKNGTAKNDYWRSVRSRNYRLQQPCVGRPDNNHYICITSGRGCAA